ncbi:MAG: glycoside hydrolase family 2 TIM barrel-domain containing protein, partial [Thermoanaerobaculia bacterium]
PSQWELQGFGRYNYGHDERKSDEQGLYRHRFEVPAAWEGRRIGLVFEGVMTDADVVLNGRSPGPEHQGAFYRFRYDVTELLQPGDNLLEVTVSKQSSDGSVNRAERDADYWVFGGIFRPVYLEAVPPESVERVAIDARHDGSLRIHAFLRNLDGPALGAPGRLRVLIEPLGDGSVSHQPLADLLSDEIAAGIGEVRLETTVVGLEPWSAETPRLYRAHVELQRDGEVLHRLQQRFGFRSVEVRPGEGLFVNDRRVLLKGVNRHAFWPAGGRTLSPRLDRRDAELIKAMNMNAVRMSHYPPDVSFLDACDELGIYVIDELAGWHDAYGTGVGRRLAREMVLRDLDHPSILAWSNGNEGGWNKRLDKVFHQIDPQSRPVIHPDDLAGGLDTPHYPSFSELASALDPATLRNRWRRRFGGIPPVMPTEILHGLYDGGSGAGLEDYWELLRSSPLGAGAFLWSFSDESVVRTDRGGVLDSDGNHAPDGILGPYRERTGNFYAVRESFSPIAFTDPPDGIFRGRLKVENRFDMTDLADCRWHWSLLDLPAPGERSAAEVLASGEMRGPELAPGGRRELVLPIDRRGADAVRVVVRDPGGRRVAGRVLPVRDLRDDFNAFAEPGGGRVQVEEGLAGRDRDRIVLTAGSTRATFDRRTGLLESLADGDSTMASSGPLPAGGRLAAPATVRRFPNGAAEAVEAGDGNGPPSLRWDLYPSGWLRLSYRIEALGPRDFLGVYFPFPEDSVRKLRWLGRGPARVWKNRLQGGTLGVWAKSGSTAPESAAEPKLEGFYAGVVWAEIEADWGAVLVAFESPDLYLGVLSPVFPDGARNAVAAVPPSGIGFYHEIPAIGTKFKEARELGPQSEPAADEVAYQGAVWLRIVR